MSMYVCLTILYCAIVVVEPLELVPKSAVYVTPGSRVLYSLHRLFADESASESSNTGWFILVFVLGKKIYKFFLKKKK